MLKKTFISLFLGLFLFISFSSTTFAQFKISGSSCVYKSGDDAIDSGISSNTNNELNVYIGEIVTLDCIPLLFSNLIFWALSFSGLVALFLFIFAGIKLITSGGDPKQIDGARKTMTWTLLGLVIILTSFALLNLFVKVIGVDACITKFGFSQCGGFEPTIEDPISCTPKCTGGRQCVKVDSGDFSCKFKCSNKYKAGWCPSGTECGLIRMVGETKVYGCK